MQTFKYWSSFIATSTAMAALFYLWKEHGYDGAGNVLGAYLWTLTVAGFIIGLDKNQKPSPKIPFARTINVIRNFGIAVACIWLEYFWLGALFFISSLFYQSAVDAARKKHEAQSTTA